MTGQSNACPVKRELQDGDAVTPAPAARRRRYTLRGATVSPLNADVKGDSKEVAKAEAGEGHDDGVSTCTGASGVEMDGSCRGCDRVYGVDPEYHDHETLVEWYLPKGRGRWCRQCHSIWHAALRDIMYLTDLPGWIGMHTEEWRLHVIAKVSLMVEKEKKITTDMLKARVVFWRKMLSLMGVTASALWSTYSALSDVTETGLAPVRAQRRPIDPRDLRTLRGAAGDRIVVPVCGPVPEGQQIVRPGLRERPVFPWLRNLSSSMAVDHERLAELFGEVIGQQAGSSTDVVAAAEPPEVVTSAIYTNVMLLHKQSLEPLAKFALASWKKDAKEQAIGKFVEKFGSAKTKAEQAGDEEAIKAIRYYQGGLCGAWDFIHHHRMWDRATKKQARLLPSLFKPAGVLWPFLLEEGVEPHLTLALLAAKCTFADLIAQGESLEESVSEMCRFVDFEKISGQLAAGVGGGVTTTGWLRGLLNPAILEQLDVPVEEGEFVAKALQVYNSITGLVSFFGGEAWASVMEVYLQELRCKAQVLQVAAVPRTAAASDTLAAFNILEAAQAGGEFVSKVETAGGTVGSFAFLATRDFLKLSMRDATADRKDAQACGILDEHKPTMEVLSAGGGAGENPRGARIKKWDDITSLRLCEVLSESHAGMSEALQQWSLRRAEEKAECFKEWCAKVIEYVRFLRFKTGV